MITLTYEEYLYYGQAIADGVLVPSEELVAAIIDMEKNVAVLKQSQQIREHLHDPKWVQAAAQEVANILTDAYGYVPSEDLLVHSDAIIKEFNDDSWIEEAHQKVNAAIGRMPSISLGEIEESNKGWKPYSGPYYPTLDVRTEDFSKIVNEIDKMYPPSQTLLDIIAKYRSEI